MEILARYGLQQTFYFPLITSGGTDFQTTWTPAAAETQISKDGGAFTNTTNTPSHEGNGIWSLTLEATETQATRIAISIIDAGADVEDQALIIHTGMSGLLESNQGILIREVETATTSATTTTFEAIAISPSTTEEATADHYNGRLILFTTGALTGQMTDITDYSQANSNESFTVTALTEAPSDTDRFVIL